MCLLALLGFVASPTPPCSAQVSYTPYRFTTVAGVPGMLGTATDGPAGSVQFDFPADVAVDADGNVYIADSNNHVIRKLSNDIVTTVAGMPRVNGSLDGAPTERGRSDGVGDAARFDRPTGIAVDRDGVIYVADSYNHTIRRGEPLPEITSQPRTQATAAGRSVAFQVAIADTLPATYQWRLNGAPLPPGVATLGDTTGPTLTLTNVGPASAGTYTVIVTNRAGSTTGAPATLSLLPPEQAGRIINLSVRTSIAAVGDAFTIGYVVGGSGTSGAKPLLLRAAGPSLNAFGIDDAVADPRLETFAGATKSGENDDWAGVPTLATATAQVGAFSYANSTSKDAAALASIATQENSIRIAANGTDTGRVLAEIYDATSAAAFSASTPRLVSVSALKRIDGSLTAGFVIGGRGAVSVLIRVIGPTLASALNVVGAISDPQCVLFAGTTPIAENNDWAGLNELQDAFARVGAFSLPPASKDAALMATLEPGSYSVFVTGTAGATGTALVEVYELP